MQVKAGGGNWNRFLKTGERPKTTAHRENYSVKHTT
jgi:hypothetical protein